MPHLLWPSRGVHRCHQMRRPTPCRRPHRRLDSTGHPDGAHTSVCRYFESPQKHRRVVCPHHRLVCGLALGQHSFRRARQRPGVLPQDCAKAYNVSCSRRSKSPSCRKSCARIPCPGHSDPYNGSPTSMSGRLRKARQSIPGGPDNQRPTCRPSGKNESRQFANTDRSRTRCIVEERRRARRQSMLRLLCLVLDRHPLWGTSTLHHTVARPHNRGYSASLWMGHKNESRSLLELSQGCNARRERNRTCPCHRPFRGVFDRTLRPLSGWGSHTNHLAVSASAPRKAFQRDRRGCSPQFWGRRVYGMYLSRTADRGHSAALFER